MTYICRQAGVKLLPRKNKFFSLKSHASNILKLKLKSLNIDRFKLQDMLYQYPQNKLIKIIDNSFNSLENMATREILMAKHRTTEEMLFNLRKEWRLELP
jgi:hypothetical protein